jgi:hypothetical protein
MPSAEPEAKKPTPEAPLEPEGESAQRRRRPQARTRPRRALQGEPSPEAPDAAAASSLRGAAVAFAALVALGAIARADGARTPEPVKILVESPHAGEVVKNQVHQAPIRGTAVALGERPIDFDIMLVIDVSGLDQERERQRRRSRRPDRASTRSRGSPRRAPIRRERSRPIPTTRSSPPRCAPPTRWSRRSAPNGRTRVGVISFSGEMNPRTGYRMRQTSRTPGSKCR